MKNQSIYLKLLPYVAAIILFIILSFAFLNPVLEGKKLKQSDITIFKGMSKELVDFREKTGDEALWTNGMFGGMPAYQISTTYPNNWIKKVDKIIKLGLPQHVNLVFLYFLGFFILLIILKVDPWLAMIGSFGFAFSSYFIIILEAGHNSKAHAIGLMAPLVGSIILTYRGKYLLGGILTALFAALEIQANHLQITYYLLLFIIILGIFILVDHIKRKAMPEFAKATGVLAIAALLAVLPNITNLWVTSEYSSQSMRGKSELVKPGNIQTSGLDKDYATQWSYGVGESWSLLIPNAKGGGSGALAANKDAMEKVDPQYRQAFSQNRISSYWGDQPFTSGPTYAGAIMVFLFVLGMFYVKGWLKWALFAGTLFSIMLAWGKNFMPLTNFMLEYFPLYNKFRAVSMILILAEFTIPVLAVLAIWEVVKKPELIQQKQREFFIAFGLTGGLLLVFYLVPNMFFNFLSQMEAQQLKGNAQAADFVSNMEAARMSIFKTDALRSFGYIFAMAAFLYAYSLKKLNKPVLLTAFAILLLADMFTINRRYVNDESFDSARRIENPYTPSVADKAILEDKSLDYRVLNLGNPFNDGATSYYHKSIGGYHSAKLGRYQDLIDSSLQPEIADLIASLKNAGSFDEVNKTLKNLNAINMLNTKYIIYNPQSPPIENPYAFGNAWFATDIVWVSNAKEELDAIEKISSKESVIIDKRFQSDLNGITSPMATDGQISMKQYTPNHLIYESQSTEKQLAVFSEIYYNKGWNAYIDGQLAPHIRVNYTLRGLTIPAGNHTVEFKFIPKSYYTGEKIALVGSILLLLAFLGIVGREIKSLLSNAKEL
jgi:Co/Zn/Cd efflux system component